jgi:anti-sigma regulatory factor (Ser/Thr protein kinase)/anti-anti-sigma regulatory factor
MDVQPYYDYIPYTLLRLDGNRDAEQQRFVNDAFETILAQEYPLYVVMDFSAVSIVPSSFITVMLEWRKKLLDTNSEISFIGMSHEVRTSLSRLGINRIFPFYSDLSTALNRYLWKYGGSAQEVKLSFPQKLRHVPPVRQLMSRSVRAKGYSSKDAFRIETIVDEVCNNAIEHGDHTHTQTITATVAISTNKIEITVKGKSDPEKIDKLKRIAEAIEQARQFPADLHTNRGKGLALVKMLSNDLKIDFSSHGTSVNVTRVKED